MSPVPTPSSDVSRPTLINPDPEPASPTAPSVRPSPSTPPRVPHRQLYGTATTPPTPPPGFASAPPPIEPPTGSLPGGNRTTAQGPSPIPTTVTVGSVRRRRSPLLIAAGAFALGGIVGAGGFGLGLQFADDSTTTANPVVNASAAPGDSTPSTQLAGPSGNQDGAGSSLGGSSGGPGVGGLEPAAAVARIIGPSVVQVETNRGQGSGVVYADGLILTNHHVIDGASRVRIRTSDGRVIETDVLGSDARNDIAVLAAPGSDLPVATIGSSAALEPGQLTVAIGSPFDLQQTVTAGIVSSVNRPVPNASNSLSAMIQTDAPINPGNSGGALANRNGELVGINASIRTDGTGNSNVGIGFAVPIDTAVRVAERIVSGDSLEPGLLGVTGASQDDGIGVPLAEVSGGSGAEVAGIEAGDRVITIEGAPVTNIEEVVGLVQSHFTGDTIELEVLRGDQRFTVEAVLS